MIKHELARVAADKEGNGLFLQYQPILDLRTNRIYGFEALARLKVDNLGLVPPLSLYQLQKNQAHHTCGRKDYSSGI